MIGAVIYYGKNTLVAELPMGTLDLQIKLSSIPVISALGRRIKEIDAAGVGKE